MQPTCIKGNCLKLEQSHLQARSSDYPSIHPCAPLWLLCEKALTLGWGNFGWYLLGFAEDQQPVQFSERPECLNLSSPRPAEYEFSDADSKTSKFWVFHPFRKDRHKILEVMRKASLYAKLQSFGAVSQSLPEHLLKAIFLLDSLSPCLESLFSGRGG